MYANKYYQIYILRRKINQTEIFFTISHFNMDAHVDKLKKHLNLIK